MVILRFYRYVISNIELYAKTKCNRIEVEVKYKRLRCLVHVLTMKHNRIQKKLLRMKPYHCTGKRKQGQPKVTWRHINEKDLIKYVSTLFCVQTIFLCRKSRVLLLLNKCHLSPLDFVKIHFSGCCNFFTF